MENLEKERSAHAAALAKRDEEYALKLEEQQSVPLFFFLPYGTAASATKMHLHCDNF